MILRLFKDVDVQQRTRNTQKFDVNVTLKRFAWATLNNLVHIHVIAKRN
jgi:hypothetical protein